MSNQSQVIKIARVVNNIQPGVRTDSIIGRCSSCDQEYQVERLAQAGPIDYISSTDPDEVNSGTQCPHCSKVNYIPAIRFYNVYEN